MDEFPFPHIVLHDQEMVWIKTTYKEGRKMPLYIQKFYPGYSWHLCDQKLFDDILESYK